MYDPREDSELMKKYVKKYAKGIVCDMGTGSGIQALEAASSKKVTKVYALDIDRGSIFYCKDVIDNNKIEFLRSDLFQVFKGDKRFKGLKFDTILFNAPYLPDEENDSDPSLYGGKVGYELVCKFLNQALHYMKDTTKVLLVFSSLTGKEQLEKFLIRKRFKFTELDKIHIFFEDIYLYLIERDNK